MSTRERFEADWLTHADGVIPPAFAEPVKEICWTFYQAAEKATALRCLELCEGEKLTDESDHPGNRVYDGAVKHCIDAIKAEFLKEQT